LQINGCNEEIERKLNYSCLENNPPEKGERNRESERERERRGMGRERGNPCKGSTQFKTECSSILLCIHKLSSNLMTISSNK
jgi:hypothetical protein